MYLCLTIIRQARMKSTDTILRRRSLDLHYNIKYYFCFSPMTSAHTFTNAIWGDISDSPSHQTHQNPTTWHQCSPPQSSPRTRHTFSKFRTTSFSEAASDVAAPEQHPQRRSPPQGQQLSEDGAGTALSANLSPSHPPNPLLPHQY